jgi:putative phosphoribosyl transferase
MFRDRRDAGRRLAELVVPYAAQRPLVIGLARGGMPVAAEVARQLHAELDTLVVRKIGLPWQPELGVGAIAEGDVTVSNAALLESLGLSDRDLAGVIAAERRELERRVQRYRGDRKPADVAGRLVILVDDGLATGSTARAAIDALRRRGARRVVLAVPVAPPDTIRELEGVADEVLALESPEWFAAIGEAYDDFGQTSDAEVAAILEDARTQDAATSPDVDSGQRPA